MFCFTLGSDWVYQHSRLAFGVGASLGDPAIYLAFRYPVDSSDCILILVFDYCIRDMCCTLFNSDMYIVASWTTIFYFRCIYYSVSVFYLFIVYAQFCQFKLTIRYFELFKSDMCGCEWSKIAGRYNRGVVQRIYIQILPHNF